MRDDQFPPILPTPLKGTLKKEDIIRAVDKVVTARLKAEAEKANAHPVPQR